MHSIFHRKAKGGLVLASTGKIFERVASLFVLVSLVACSSEPANDRQSSPVAPSMIVELRLAGKLNEAREAVEAELAQPELNARSEIALRLELAKIYDRVGLHTNSRPVEAALVEIERAQRRRPPARTDLPTEARAGSRARVVR